MFNSNTGVFRMAKPVFKKGDKVTYIADWDRKGTVYFQQAVVYSCGKKQMVLTDEKTGNEMGRHFKPELGSTENRVGTNGGTYMAGGVWPRLTAEEATEIGMKVAASIREFEDAHFARCLAGNHGEAYDRGIRESMAKLHDLKVIER
jgi:hypothetical protein